MDYLKKLVFINPFGIDFFRHSSGLGVADSSSFWRFQLNYNGDFTSCKIELDIPRIK